MLDLDTSANRRIPLLTHLFESITRCIDPHELLDTFVRAMRSAYGNRCFVQLSTAGLPPGQYRVMRCLTHDDRDLVEYPGPRPHERPVHSDGIFARVVADDRPKILHDLDLSDEPALRPYRSLMAVPAHAGAVGTDWIILMDREPAPFTEESLEDLLIRANLVNSMLNNLVATQRLRAANEHIAKEIDAISRIQRALLPDALPVIPGLAVAASYHTFDRAGGDIYDIARLNSDDDADGTVDPDPRYAILIGDVSGHGPAAAVVMAMFHAILHAYPFRPAGPAEVLDHVNRHLCAKRIDGSFITAFLAFYDPATRALTYARAGHPPPILKDFPHAGPPLHLDAVGEIPLGMLPDVGYSETTLTLRGGQTLILYTDGITESRPDGSDVMFGLDGVETSLIACTGAPQCAVTHITDALHKHQRSRRPTDDQTVLAIQVL